MLTFNTTGKKPKRLDGIFLVDFWKNEAMVPYFKGSILNKIVNVI